MTLLIAGLVLFMIPHLLGLAGDVKPQLKERFGAAPYKGGHALLSLIGLVLIVIGYQQSEFIPVYDPLQGRALPHALMPFAFILLAGANMRSNLKQFVAHPMSLGVLLWAVSHLAVNGDLASLLLFGAFGAFAIVNMATAEAGPRPPLQPHSKDVILVAAGLTAYGAALWLHGALGGVWVIG